MHRNSLNQFELHCGRKHDSSNKILSVQRQDEKYSKPCECWQAPVLRIPAQLLLPHQPQPATAIKFKKISSCKMTILTISRQKHHGLHKEFR